MPITLLLAGKRRARTGSVALASPLGSTTPIGILSLDTIAAGGLRVVSISRISSFGVALVFLLDGLSLFFGLVVSGMGALVVEHLLHAWIERHWTTHFHNQAPG